MNLLSNAEDVVRASRQLQASPRLIDDFGFRIESLCGAFGPVRAYCTDKSIVPLVEYKGWLEVPSWDWLGGYRLPCTSDDWKRVRDELKQEVWIRESAEQYDGMVREADDHAVIHVDSYGGYVDRFAHGKHHRQAWREATRVPCDWIWADGFDWTLYDWMCDEAAVRFGKASYLQDERNRQSLAWMLQSASRRSCLLSVVGRLADKTVAAAYYLVDRPGRYVGYVVGRSLLEYKGFGRSLYVRGIVLAARNGCMTMTAYAEVSEIKRSMLCQSVPMYKYERAAS